MKLEDYASTKEAAEYLDVSHTSGRVNRLIKDGLLEAQKLGGTLFVTRKSLEAYKAKRGNRKGGRYSSE